MPTYSPVRVFSRQYCGECLTVHWMEEVTRTRFVCHGRYYTPRETPTHYTRWRAGTIELCEKIGGGQDVINDWFFAEQVEEAEEIQKW